jgi:2-methylaconitate cis-trans-isomerase PrpF
VSNPWCEQFNNVHSVRQHNGTERGVFYRLRDIYAAQASKAAIVLGGIGAADEAGADR